MEVRPAELAEPQQQLEIGEVFSLHYQRVSGWVRRLGGPGIEADDAVQEVFLIALRRLHRFSGREKLVVWLYRITEFVVREQRRAMRRRRRMLSDSPTKDREASEVPAQGPLPSDQVNEAQSLRLIYEVLDTMSERSRTLFILFELEGLSGQEIAELRGARVATVRVWLHRARAEFKRHIKDLRCLAPDSLSSMT